MILCPRGSCLNDGSSSPHFTMTKDREVHCMSTTRLWPDLEIRHRYPLQKQKEVSVSKGLKEKMMSTG